MFSAYETNLIMELSDAHNDTGGKSRNFRKANSCLTYPRSTDCRSTGADGPWGHVFSTETPRTTQPVRLADVP
jgi:hypothetical protein